MPPYSCSTPGKKPGVSTKVSKGVLKALQKRTNRATLSDASISSTPASTLGWFATIPTAQLGAGEPHAWFAGFAPYEGDAVHRIAFAVLVEHGGYGGQVAAPIAREIMEAAKDLGLVP